MYENLEEQNPSKRKKTANFTCFYITILYQSCWIYKTKHNTLLYYKKIQQKRTPTKLY